MISELGQASRKKINLQMRDPNRKDLILGYETQMSIIYYCMRKELNKLPERPEPQVAEDDAPRVDNEKEEE